MKAVRDCNPLRSTLRTVLVLLMSTAALVFVGAPPGQACCGSPGSVAPYDFNGDGYADLAIGAIEVPFNETDTGWVTVLYGSATGITTNGSQLWSQDSPGIPDASEMADSFGQSLASGNFNGDGYADLAIAAPGENLAGYDEGVIHILFGSASGLTSSGTQLWSQDTPGVLDVAQSGDEFGEVMAAGNLGNGSYDDLVIGLPNENYAPRDGAEQSNSGAVQVLFGSATGLTSVGNQFWSQQSPGVPGNADAGDFFGDAVLVAEVTGDTVDDVVIGVPRESLSGVRSGAVHVLPGSSAGPTVTGSSTWTQATAGVADSPEEYDGFGRSLAAGDFGGSSHQELAIGAPGESVVTGQTVNGAVHVLMGSSAGLTATGSQFWSQNSSGVLETAETNDAFGQEMSAANLGKSGQDDLVIGVGETIVGTYHDGVVHVLYGSSSGLTSTGNQLWHPDIPGVPDELDAEEMFGFQLQVGDYGGGTIADLVAGSPTETVDGVYGVGAVTVIYGGSAGLTSAGSQFITPATPGVPGDPEGNSRWGQLGR
jgi:hypothetical protein